MLSKIKDLFRKRLPKDYLDEVDPNKELEILLESTLKDFSPSYKINDNVFESNYKITFGIEIEFKLGDITRIDELVRFLNNNVLSNQKELIDTQAVKIQVREERRKRLNDVNGWKLETEANNSFELKSPKLTDCKTHWHQISLICKKLREIGAFVDDDCGFHVHIGSEALFDKGPQWLRLRKIYSFLEVFTYLLSSGNEKSVSQKRIEQYAIPLKIADEELKWQSRSVEEILEAIKNEENLNLTLCNLYARKYCGMNWRNMSESSIKTIEFRTFNGSLFPELLQTYLMYVVSIIELTIQEKQIIECIDNYIMDEQSIIDYIKLNPKYIIECINLINNNELKRRVLWYLSKNNFTIPINIYKVLIGQISNENKRILRR